jgi:hypothetical protein
MANSQAYNMKPVISNVAHWEIINKYLAVEIDRLVTRLQTCEEKDLKKIQGEIAALRKIELLPDQLKTEQGTKR